jgi:hypothetical protein
MPVPKFAENQSNASEADLQYKSPLDFREERFKGGVEQITASEASIAQSPWDLLPMNVGANNGTRQTTASSADLSMTPEHGWRSYPTPPSDRARKQSE